MLNTTNIIESISTIQGIDYTVSQSGLQPEYVRVVRESDNQIMHIAPYADEEETCVGVSTYLDQGAVSEGDYIHEDAVEIDSLEEFVTEWAND